MGHDLCSMERPVLSFNLGKLEGKAREALLGSRLFSPLRFGYQLLFDRSRLAHRCKMRSFYAPFVREGDLVFDIGAHVGRHSEVFADLGAKVVAVEPNPQCFKQLEHLARIRDIHIERRAAGDARGSLKLMICHDSVISTVVEAWYEETRRSDIHKNTRWVGSVEVEVVTLDQLADRYGIPAFVKIDAEGYDDHVLKGMSFRPRGLCFEYNRLLPEVGMRCFETPALSSGYVFNFSRGLDLKYVSEDWMEGQEICMRLSDFVGNEEYGDVLAVRALPPGRKLAKAE